MTRIKLYITFYKLYYDISSSIGFVYGVYKDKWKLTERLQKSALKFPLQFISHMTRTTFKNEF